MVIILSYGVARYFYAFTLISGNFAIIDIAPYTKEQKNQQPSGPSIAFRYISLLAGYATGSRCILSIRLVVTNSFYFQVDQ